MRQLLDRFRGPEGAKLLQRRGSLIVCRLAALLGGRRVFRALAAVLADADDLRFVSALVQALNLILLTAPEVCIRDPLLRARALCRAACGAGHGGLHQRSESCREDRGLQPVCPVYTRPVHRISTTSLPSVCAGSQPPDPAAACAGG